MPRHEVLDNVQHKNLRIDRRPGPGRGLDVQLVRVFPVELGALQAEYPLFMCRNQETGHFDLVALLGLEDGENLYLGDGEWLARSQPLSVERQPFLIGFQSSEVSGGGEPVPVVHIDVEHPAVSESVGEPVFLPHGGESPLLERISTVLATIHAGHQESEAFSRLLVGLDLIESLNLDVELNDGSHRALSGLYTVNEERLGSLDGESLATLHRQGNLQHLYMLLASMPQLAVLVERKNQQLAASKSE